MKIFDCFMFYDEDLILDLRLNILNKYVDKFVIVESKFTHSGEERKLLFNKNKYKTFESKIAYIVLENEPSGLSEIKADDTFHHKNSKYIMNAVRRENYQRNAIKEGLYDADKDDLVIISDLDEIPNLSNVNFKNIKNKFIFFKQDMMYYKFNLKLENCSWVGTKACQMKNLESPQWLRNIKDRSYSWWRLDTLFSKNK